jgi:hypothetical protein
VPKPEQAAPSDQFASPTAYTPKHLAEKILSSKAALEGERKQVTVLFADVVGSMNLAAERPATTIDAEARQRQIFEAFTRLQRARSARHPFVAIFEDLHSGASRRRPGPPATRPPTGASWMRRTACSSM